MKFNFVPLCRKPQSAKPVQDHHPTLPWSDQLFPPLTTNGYIPQQLQSVDRFDGIMSNHSVNKGYTNRIGWSTLSDLAMFARQSTTYSVAPTLLAALDSHVGCMDPPTASLDANRIGGGQVGTLLFGTETDDRYRTAHPGTRSTSAYTHIRTRQPGVGHIKSALGLALTPLDTNNGDFDGKYTTSDKYFHDRVRVLAAGTHKPPPPGLVRTKTSRRDTLGRPYGFTHVPVDSPRHELVVRLKSKRYKGHYLELMDIHSDGDSGTSSDNDGGFHRPSISRDCKASKPGGRIARVRETTSGPQYGL